MEELTSETVRGVREKLKLGVHYILPNQMILNPALFLDRYGIPMSEERRVKRLAAIERLIRIRLRRSYDGNTRTL